MSEYFGKGVGRHISSKDRQYTSVLFQKGKPPLAEEFNLFEDAMEKARQSIIQSNTSSGFITDVFDPMSDYAFDKNASNMFWLGSETKPLYAIVNGWVIPIAGTFSDDLKSAIKLPPPPTNPSSQDVNFVFLEVWKSRLKHDSTENKPNQDQIFRFGNVEYGGTNLANQILDPTLLVETTQRVQLQYRIRVIPNVTGDTYPHGFNPSIRSQGPLSAPIASSNVSFQYQNMAEEMGDSGLWRAGIPNDMSVDGTKVFTKSPLGTLDGYVYAIPICFVFRRNSLAWEMDQHGSSLNRNPSMTSRLEARSFPKVEILNTISESDTVLEVNVSRSETTFPETNGLIKINGEILRYTSWIDTEIQVAERAYRSGSPTLHSAGSEVEHVSDHPSGLFSDQIVADDILDLRHAVNLKGFSYDALLKHNFKKLIKGQLKTSWRQSEGGVKGLKHFQVDQFTTGPTTPSFLERDAPDNFRKIFSDACALQPNNLMVIRASDSAVSSTAYTFNLTNATLYRNTPDWEKGDNIRIPLEPLRQTFKDVDRRKVRFVHPLEYVHSSHEPVKVRFNGNTLVEGLSENLIVLGSKPNNVNESFLTGLSSSITYVGDDDITITLGGGGQLDFSTASPDPSMTVAQYLAEHNAFIVIEDSLGDNPTFKGAYKIEGLAQGTGLKVTNPDDSSPDFGGGAGISRNASWRIRLRSCSETDEEMIVVLQNKDSEPTLIASDETMFLVFDVLYHPNQGLARCPDQVKFARIQPSGGTPYLRPNTPANVVYSSESTVKDYSVVPLESYPLDRSEVRIRENQDLNQCIEDTWAEAYVDTGSKTALFQPIRRSLLSLSSDANPTGSTSLYVSGAGSNPTLGFQLQDGNPCYYFPSEIIPPRGRIDLPFVHTTSGESPYGYNFLFSSLLGSNAANAPIVKNRVLLVYDHENLNPNQYGSFIPLASLGSGAFAQESALVCRVYDKGGVRGLELPPHFGIARLFGAYDKDSFFTNGSQFTSGSLYRTEVNNWDGFNLLKQNPFRSLVITEDNTFVIPEDVLNTSVLGTDLSRSPMVIETSLFMFNDWGADNVQIHTIQGQPSGDQQFQMLLNGACATTDAFYYVSTRVPYQGNVNGTMAKSSLDSGSLGFFDYDFKEEADQSVALGKANIPLDRREARFDNPAHLQILASLPFVTTLGTGRISGEYKSGSYTDVGSLSNEGFPYISGRRTSVSNVIHEDVKPSRISAGMNGITERLPLGLLASDHIMIGEPLGGSHTTFKIGDSCLNGSHLSSHLTEGHALSNELGRVCISDGTHGGNASGVAYNHEANMYRTYRGGTLTEAQEGGAVHYSGERAYKEFPHLKSFEQEYQEILLAKMDGMPTPEFEARVEDLKDKYSHIFKIHGGIVFGVAFLVRTGHEVVTENDYVMNWGQELQMLVVTGMSVSNTSSSMKDSVETSVQLHPTGLGERFCAADRYRIEGRPLDKPSTAPDKFPEIYRGAYPILPLPKCE